MVANARVLPSLCSSQVWIALLTMPVSPFRKSGTSQDRLPSQADGADSGKNTSGVKSAGPKYSQTRVTVTSPRVIDCMIFLFSKGRRLRARLALAIPNPMEG
jgi:hypothetical protein